MHNQSSPDGYETELQLIYKQFKASVNLFRRQLLSASLPSEASVPTLPHAKFIQIRTLMILKLHRVSRQVQSIWNETQFKREQKFIEFYNVRNAALACCEMDGKTIDGNQSLPVTKQHSNITQVTIFLKHN
ncbi:hypothetical protein YC2023_029070 [Brassica napus]